MGRVLGDWGGSGCRSKDKPTFSAWTHAIDNKYMPFEREWKLENIQTLRECDEL